MFATVILCIGIVSFHLSTTFFYLLCVARTKPKLYIYAPYVNFMSFVYIVGGPRNEAWHPAFTNEFRFFELFDMSQSEIQQVSKYPNSQPLRQI